MQKEKCTAPELAEKFEVFRRTINRDMQIKAMLIQDFTVNDKENGAGLTASFFVEKYFVSMSTIRKLLMKKLRKPAEENQGACWLMMNGNRIQIKRKLFEKVIDELGAI